MSMMSCTDNCFVTWCLWCLVLTIVLSRDVYDVLYWQLFCYVMSMMSCTDNCFVTWCLWCLVLTIVLSHDVYDVLYWQDSGGSNQSFRSTGGTVAWLLKLQFKMLSTAVLNRNCHNITLYYQYYSKQECQEMWLLWREKVLIREIWLNIFT